MDRSSRRSRSNSSMHTLESSTTIPTFILKLWKLVSDKNSDHLVSWNRNGRSFIIKDQAHFAKELLPLYFKHNNMASFIRQLNMYGFRKVSNIEHSGLKADGDEVEFYHPCFSLDNEDQLQYIKRKMSNNNKSMTSIMKVDEFHDILTDVESIKGRQDSVDTLLNSMKQENEALWREVAILRQKHLKQQQIVEKLLQFLVSIVRNRVVGGIKRKAPPLLIDSSAANVRKVMKSSGKDVFLTSDSSGPIIHDITDQDEAHFMADSPSEQLINTIPVSELEGSGKLSESTEGVSLLAPSNHNQDSISTSNADTSNVNDNDALIALNSFPNNIFDIDLGQDQIITPLEDDYSLDGNIKMGTLDTPQIMYNDDLQPSSSTNPNTSEMSTDLVLKQKSPTNTPFQRLTSETFNDHVDGIDAELNLLQDQLYGGSFNIDPSTILGLFSTDSQILPMFDSNEPSTSTSMLPKAITDKADNCDARLIKMEDNGDSNIFDALDLNNITTDDKVDFLSEFANDIDPSTFA